MSYIDAEELLRRTNGGLEIIFSYYPQASEAERKKDFKFKIREEKTPSATLKKLADGNYVVTDFGDDGESRNGIQIAMKEENCDFKTALTIIVERLGLGTDLHKTMPAFKADFERRDATPDEAEGEYYFDVYEKCPEIWLPVLGPFVKEEHLQFMRWKSLKSFTYIKNRKALVTKSTDEYPIFMIEEEGFKKIYQPNNPDKKYRFRYSGTKPKEFIHGLDQLQKKHSQMVADYTAGHDAEEEKYKEPKLPEIILCSGDLDALNVHSLGYCVIWKNSETDKLTGKTYRKIATITECLYNLPDIDATGVRMATDLALIYLDMKTIWLPKFLLDLRDWRGNKCKDVTDFISRKGFEKKHFKAIYDYALQAKFWNERHDVDKNGVYKGTKYEFSNTRAYYFLALNGIYRFANPNERSGFMFIRIVGNIVEEINTVDIKNFVNKFLEDRKMNIDLRDMIYKTTQLDEKSLSNLQDIEIDFTDFDKQTQFLFFENETWEITKDNIKKHRPGDADKFVWKDEVIPHRVKLIDDFFTVTRTEMEDGQFEFDIEIKDKSCVFFRYLINTSRVHWKKEDEIAHGMNRDKKAVDYLEENRFSISGNWLDEDEIYEQKLHLINKMYSIGYLMHRYKEPSRPWCVFAMDHKISDDGESHGGSGKSICYNSLRTFMKSVTLNGRNKRLTENPHIYENVTEHTDYVFIDDANRYIDFQFFFKAMTGDLDVNPKNNRQYSIKFEDAPKFCITSNYTLNNIDPSTERRLLYTVFSDYYHYNSNGEYREHRDPKSDFGKNMFNDFTEEEWNLFFNFVAQCVKMYLCYEKIDPPMNNVTKRNLISAMTQPFKDWADVFFGPNSDKLNIEVVKREAFENFQEETKMYKWSSHRFTKSLKAWCRYNLYILNPGELCDKEGRIIKKVNDKSEEHIYIKTVSGNAAVIDDFNDTQIKVF